MTERTGAQMVNDAVNYPAEKYIEKGGKLLNHIDAFLGLDPKKEAQKRADLLDEIITLDVLDGVQKRGALSVPRTTAARGRLIRAGILRKKTPRSKWTIDPAKDPRSKI